jgi:hypothetical protein
MLTAIIGNGLGLLLAGIAWLLAKFRYDLPGRATADIALSTAIVGMLLAGELTRATGLGHWLAGLVSGGENLIGSGGVIVLTLATLLVIGLVARHLAGTATSAGLSLAFALPFLLAAFHAGALHQLDMHLQTPAYSIAQRISTALGA